jgi:hypothetical protein
MEEVSFLGPTVLPEIKKALTLLPAIDKATLQKLVDLSIHYLKVVCSASLPRSLSLSLLYCPWHFVC